MDGVGTIRVTETAQIGRYCLISGVHHRRNLMSPKVPPIRKPMHEEYDRTTERRSVGPVALTWTSVQVFTYAMRAYLPMADRQRQLIDAGLTIAERDGVSNVTVRRVAAEAGVSLGLVSYCFGSKEELILAMATQIVQELVDHSDPGPDDNSSPEGIGQVLRAALTGMWRQVERTPGRQLLTYEITTRSLRDPGLGEVAKHQYEATAALAAVALERAAQTAGVTWTRDLDHLAGLVVMAIDGVTLRWLVDHDSEAALARLGDVADLLTTMTV